VIDIMKPGNQNHRTYMRDRGKKKDGQRNVLPPQIFNGDDYIGDFEDFDLANEDDVLEEFLGIERENPKVEPYKTGAVAPDVAKRVVGKLPKERIPVVVKNEQARGPKKATKSSSGSSSSSTAVTDTASTSASSSCFGETDSGVDFEEESSEKISDDDIDDGGDSDDESEAEEDQDDKKGMKSKRDICEGDSDGDKQDGSGAPVDDVDVSNDIDEETDSDDFTDSEDDTIEFMPDGEQVRKCKRGFKVLQNCKRFWKVDNNV